MKPHSTCLLVTFLLLFSTASGLYGQDRKSFDLKLRHRVETATDSDQFHAIEKNEVWRATETAFVVCDMLNLHHSHNATIRVGQLAPRMEKVLSHARNEGATIIHAPSSCIKYYVDHPARKRAQSAPMAPNLPIDIDQWCDSIESEKLGAYPIDQSDGGDDDEPEDHQKWLAKLKSQGLDPGRPWSRQIDVLTIDGGRDFISDHGSEIWSILEDQKIKNVVLLGVHTNMCVLGRPFGLRQLSKNKKNVVLMRDLTDTMYNPNSSPFVSHFKGTDLIVEHIEKYICPTITSQQLIGGEPFVFPSDSRPHIVIVMAEDEYATDKTLPDWAAKHLAKDFRVSLVFGSKAVRNDIPGLQALHSADLLMLSIRRKNLPQEQLQIFRDYEATGKPMVGIRTASHPFCLMKNPPPNGLSEWREFDSVVWGGNYHGHTKNGAIYELSVDEDNVGSRFLNGVDASQLRGHKSLYNTSPLAPNTRVLLDGHIVGAPKTSQPVTWLNKRGNGGPSFYTSMGHVDDFKQAGFQLLLANACKELTGVNGEPAPSSGSSTKSKQ